MENLARAVMAGDPVALARAISLVEEGAPSGERILGEVFRGTGRASLIGVTGPPGAGKSSLVNRLVTQYRSRGARLGVVAIDPSSAFSGGAILGDRIRMQQHTLDPDVFIRSMATRGRFGGLSRATRDAVDLMDAAGRDPILIETVGVGQDEVDVVRVADTVLVVLTPGQGDDIQAIKAGLLEIADVFVINKADHPGADRLSSDLEGMLALGEKRDWTPPIVMHLRQGNGLERRRRGAIAARFSEILRDRLMARIVSGNLGAPALERYETRLLAREIDPYSAAREVLSHLEAEPTGGSGDGRPPVLDHLGVAVRRIEDRLALYRDVLGLELRGIEPIEAEGVRVAMLPAGRTRIELVEPIRDGTSVARFLEKRGEGIHHLCFAVDDLDATLDRFRRAGLEIAGSEGRPGAEGSRIAFIHPRATGGVLIELREAREDDRGAAR
ncbi:MAG: methylmalonyl-CoA epimerase [Acidobacteria bacterium 13_1_20CM_2_68_7]|nr:MAG: methylmalonyl-CoA epimerase [Acidobacteria bacterium 13_1_20CM_2_68_7]